MFAVHIVLNEKGKARLFEGIQSHIDDLTGLSELFKRYKIKEEYVESIEIIDSKNWDGWNH